MATDPNLAHAPQSWGNYVWCEKVPSRTETTIIETG
jgi:hypothetical protein